MFLENSIINRHLGITIELRECNRPHVHTAVARLIEYCDSCPSMIVIDFAAIDEEILSTFFIELSDILKNTLAAS